MRQKTQKARLREEIASVKGTYENKIKEMLNQKLEAQVDLTTFYHQKIDYLEAELVTSAKIRDMLEKNNLKLKEEIKTVSKVIKTSRMHFKELENCDYEALTGQIEKYEEKVAELKVSESQI